MRGIKKLSKEDKALWQVFVKQIKPLKPVLMVEESETPLEFKPLIQALPLAIPEKPKTKIKPLSPIEKNIKTDLKRGKIEPSLKLDLHGFTQETAYSRLYSFLEMAFMRGERIVIVVTGKGKTSGEIGVLRRSLPGWLTNVNLRHIVMGFEEAHIHHGGSGAMYIRLRRNNA